MFQPLACSSFDFRGYRLHGGAHGLRQDKMMREQYCLFEVKMDVGKVGRGVRSFDSE